MEKSTNDFNPSSLLELKAELLRKKEEVKKEKPQNSKKRLSKAHLFKKTSVWSKQNAGVQQRAQKDLDFIQEEQDVMTKSKKQLEAKAQLYESMTAGKDIPEEDGSKVFLVDFQQKAIHSISERREQLRIHHEEEKQRKIEEAKRKFEEEEERMLLNEPVPNPNSTEEEWIDYVDSFGRSRRCMRKDLPDLMEMDKKLQGKKKSEDVEPDNKELMSADMHRELIRQKWEAVKKESMDNPNGEIHYSNVQYNEIRTHGTGYFQFSKSEESRQQQLDALKDLRQQTKDMRDKKEKLKERKKAIMKARLAKIKRRKLIKEGKNPDDISDDSTSDDEGLIGPSVEEKHKEDEMKEPELLQRDKTLKDGAPVREWDFGKEEMKIFSEEKWLQERRSERLDEFAPPTMYYDSQPNQISGKMKKRTIGDKQSQFAPPDEYLKPSETKIARLSKNVLKSNIVIENTNETIRHKNKPVLATIKKDPMSLLDDAKCNEIRKDWVKAKDPMTMLEQEMEVNMECEKDLENNVSEGLHAIRSLMEMSNKNEQPQLKTKEHVDDNSLQDISCIPLPNDENKVDSTKGEHGKDPDVKSCETINSNNELYNGNLNNSYNTVNYNEGCSQYYYGYGQSDKNYECQVSESFPSDNTNMNVYTEETYVPKSETSMVGTFTDMHTSNECKVETNNTPNTNVEAVSFKAPQPAHFSAAPTKIDPRLAAMTKYERVNLYEVPDQLPAPPSEVNVPQYPSMEDIIGSKQQEKDKSKHMSEEDLKKQWCRQFGGNASNIQTYSGSSKTGKKGDIERIKPTNIPFVSPYVQKDVLSNEKSFKEIDFDPSKPPPCS